MAEHEDAMIAEEQAQGSDEEPDDSRRDSLLALDQLVVPSDLRVVFQPIVELSNRRVFAQEALVRCSVPELSPPPTLFDHAVRTQCSGRLGRLIRQIAVPLCAGSRLFVNVHPAELDENWLVRPDDPIFSHDHEVYIEVTESAPLQHLARSINVLREIRSRGGIFIVVDDLGTGYSNLKLLADLAPDVVKLDRILVDGLAKNHRMQKLVAGIVRLCRELGATVVGEGIETAEDLEAARAVGVKYGQGYLFGRPVPPAT